MAKYTTTLMDIIQSELQKKGFNEFVNDGKLTYNDKSYAFIQKVLRFDEDVKNIVDDIIFQGFRFNDERIDRYFKQAFVTRFLDREINRQTVEAFGSQVLFFTITHEDTIYTVFGDELYKYLENHVDFNSDEIGNMISEETNEEKEEENYTSDRDMTGHDTTDNRELTSSLPQSQINLNVDNDILNYGDDNTISKNKNDSTNNESTKTNRDVNGNGKTNGTQDTTGNTKSLTKTYLLENLEKIYSMRERLINDYDKKCFLQIW